MSGTFSARILALAPLAIRELGWSPNTFWNATPADLALAMGNPASGDAPPTRAEIDRLIEQDRIHDRRYR